MSFEQKPGTTQVQRLSLTPEIKQSLLILQLPVPELQTYLARQVIENCLLEYETCNNTADNEEADNPEQLFSETRDTPEAPITNNSIDTDWEDNYQTEDTGATLITGFRTDISQSSTLSGFTGTGLHDYLLLQLHVTAQDPREQLIGEYLIENIDDDGYLYWAPDEVVQVLNADLTEIEHILQLIQSFEPLGAGARNIEECLRIQLEAEIKHLSSEATSDLYDLALHITENFLNEVAEGQVVRIAKSTHRSITDVANAIAIIKKLNPKPGRSFDDNIKANYVLPDVTVKKVDRDLEIEVTEISPAKLQVNHYYQHLLTHCTQMDPDTVNFLKERYQAALWLMKCLEQRKITIAKVTAAIVQVQQGFFKSGADDLKPLTLHMISEMVGLDESTISRAIHQKYILTPQGIYPLKYFFTSGLHTSDGETVSSVSIKKLIREAIHTEDSSAPFSDQQLTEALKSKGIDISRRTVTKYREEMTIPSSNKRKRFSARPT